MKDLLVIHNRNGVQTAEQSEYFSTVPQGAARQFADHKFVATDSILFEELLERAVSALEMVDPDRSIGEH
jgi:hypothetical protein